MIRWTRNRRWIAMALLAGALTAPQLLHADVSKLSHTEREGLIFERQQIMEHMESDAELIGNIVAGIEPASKLPEATAAIARGARESAQSFKLHLPGGRSKPEVWTNNADFTARMDAWVRSADAMAGAGKSGKVADVIPLMVDAMPCKACHDVYRAPKTPVS